MGRKIKHIYLYGVSDVNVKSEHKEMSPKRERKKGALKGSVKRESEKGA